MVFCALFPGIIHFFALYPNTYNTVIFPVLLPKLISTYSFFGDNWFNTFSFKRDTIFFLMILLYSVTLFVKLFWVLCFFFMTLTQVRRSSFSVLPTFRSHPESHFTINCQYPSVRLCFFLHSEIVVVSSDEVWKTVLF